MLGFENAVAGFNKIINCHLWWSGVDTRRASCSSYYTRGVPAGDKLLPRIYNRTMRGDDFIEIY